MQCQLKLISSLCIITLSHVKEMVVYVTNGEEVEVHQLQKLFQKEFKLF